MIEELFIDNKNKLTKLPIKTGYIARNNNDKIDVDNILPSLKNFNVCEYNINSTSESFDENGLSLIQHEIEKFKNKADNLFYYDKTMMEYNISMSNCKVVSELSNINFSIEPNDFLDIEVPASFYIGEIYTDFIGLSFSFNDSYQYNVNLYFAEATVCNFRFENQALLETIDKVSETIKNKTI